MLKIGTRAPEFSLPDQNGELHTLSSCLGRKVPACTSKTLTQGVGTGWLTEQHHRRCGVWVLGLKGLSAELQGYRSLTEDEGHGQWAGRRA